MIGKVMMSQNLQYANVVKILLSTILFKTLNIDKNLYFVSRLLVLIHYTITTSSPFINLKLINFMLTKSPICGFKIHLVSSKKVDFTIGFYILPILKESKLLIKLSILNRIRK